MQAGHAVSRHCDDGEDFPVFTLQLGIAGIGIEPHINCGTVDCSKAFDAEGLAGETGHDGSAGK